MLDIPLSIGGVLYGSQTPAVAPTSHIKQLWRCEILLPWSIFEVHYHWHLPGPFGTGIL